MHHEKRVQTDSPFNHNLHTLIMKKLFTLAIVAAGLFTLAPTNAEAGHYRSRVIGSCQHCHQSIYSYYRPFRNSCGQTYYSWVPSYHSNCASRYRSSYTPSYGRSSYYSSGYRSGCNSYGGTSIHRQLQRHIIHRLSHLHH